MEYNIIVNSKIYEKYKDDVINLSPRLFTTSYFYDLKNYEDPIDLKGIKNYIAFTDKITIHSTSTFIDFINVLLILAFLKKCDYQKSVIINYYLLKGKTLNSDKYVCKELKLIDYENAIEIIDNIKNFSKIKGNYNYLPGMYNFTSFYNNLCDKDLFLEMVDSEIDEELTMSTLLNYLEENYFNMGVSSNFYKDYFKDYFEDEF